MAPPISTTGRGAEPAPGDLIGARPVGQDRPESELIAGREFTADHTVV